VLELIWSIGLFALEVPESRLYRQKVAYLTFALVLAAAFASALPFCGGGVAQASDLPIHIHLTWQQSNMSDSMSVTWQTANSDSGDLVFYDTVSRNGNVSLYGYSTTGTHFTYTGASGYIHNVELNGLEPNSTYYFVCGGENGGYSAERKFRTAPVHPSSVRFVAGGDSRTNLVERDRVSAAMSAFDPSFVLMCGDFVEDGTAQSQWDDFFTSLDSIWVDSSGFTIPIVPCIGNHENQALNYYQQFALPGNEQWFSLDWGDLLHIIVLSTETTLTGSQQAWLQADLEAHQNSLWKVALFHQPAYSAGASHYSNINVRNAWCPLFDQYHVQVVVAGHNHNYERSKPIYNNSVASSFDNGTVHLTSGGWGAPLSANGSDWWTDYSASLYHFVLMDAFANGTLNLQAKNNSGSTFDEATLEEVHAPTISILSPENKTYPANNVPLTFTVSESTSWTGYSLDGLANITIGGNTTLNGLPDGSHYVVVYANDTAGNTGSSDIIHFSVDTTPPNITDVSQIPLPSNVLPTDGVKVNATVVDNFGKAKQVTLNFTIGNGTWVTSNMTNLEGNIWNGTIPAFPIGTFVNYTILAEDYVGNTITTEEVLGYQCQYQVVPEFPSFMILPLSICATLLLAAITYRRKSST
jgi:hypothetical protein